MVFSQLIASTQASKSSLKQGAKSKNFQENFRFFDKMGGPVVDYLNKYIIDSVC